MSLCLFLNYYNGNSLFSCYKTFKILPIREYYDFNAPMGDRSIEAPLIIFFFFIA